MPRRLLSPLVAAALLCCAPCATAAVVTGTFTGQISSGLDFAPSPGSSLFGVGSNLAGSAVQGRFTYDTAAVADVTGADGAEFAEGFLDFAVTIGSVEYVFGGFEVASGADQRRIFLSTSPDGLTFTLTRDGGADYETLSLTLGGASFLSGLTLPESFRLGEGAGSGLFYVAREDGTVAFADIDLTSARVGAAVPEPAAWSLMIAGFGLAGAALRSRGRIAAA